MNNFLGYDAVIFDKDGVLLNSMNDNFRWADKIRMKMAEKNGKELSLEETRKIVHAKTRRELEKISNKTGVTLTEMKKMEEKVLQKKIEKMQNGEIGLFQETKHVLEEIKKPKSVVSNAPYRATKFTVENFGLEKYFTTIKSPSIDDIGRYTELKKPNPKMVEEAIQKMDAENPVMVGDSSDDIQVAKNTGIDSIFVDTNGGTDLTPTHYTENLEEILEIVN